MMCLKLVSSLRPICVVTASLILGSISAHSADAPRRDISGNAVASYRSPEVATDRRVTFRLQAPNAKEVTLLGDFTGDTIPMTKDDKGIWSYTTEPLPAGYYQYWFTMDGLTMPDPINTYVRPASGVYKSQVDVPGPGTEWMDFRDVPHGALHEHWYLNKENGTARRVVVYTPPGYNAGTERYPVIYLLHGNADFERGWTQAGRANLIMDNLIADGKTVPAILVMPFGHNVSGSSGKLAEVSHLQAKLGITPTPPPQPIAAPPPAAPGGAPAIPFGGRGGPGLGAANYMDNDLTKLVIPMIEREYRVKADKANRAIVGYSMGGGHSTAIGFNHPELFAYIGAFSGASSEAGIPKAFADVAKTNQEYKLIWVGCGDSDPIATVNMRNFHQLLVNKGVKHEWVETPGARHDYQIWRVYLRDLAPKLFR